MNTQTHLLLACAVLVPAFTRLTIDKRQSLDRIADSQAASTSTPSAGLITFAALLGALIPDISLFVMWGIAKAQGVAESVIWQEWYYSEFWQRLGAITNSIPVFLAFALVAWFTLKRSRLIMFGHWILVFSLGAILHAVSDLPLHHDDGHPHFWPLSDWIYRSPISYWDPAHHGRVWSVIELGLALGLLIFLWNLYRHLLARCILIATGLSYAAMIGYWWMVF